MISVSRCDRGHKFRRRNLHGACWAGKALNDGDLIASLSPPRPLRQADVGSGSFEANRRRSAPARVAVHGLNASTAMLDDDKQAPSVAAWKNEQLVLAPFAGNQGSRLRHGAGSAADIERFWRVDHRHGRMLTLAKWKFVSGQFGGYLRPLAANCCRETALRRHWDARQAARSAEAAPEWHFTELAPHLLPLPCG